MKSEWKTSPLRDLVGFISKGIAPSYADEESETTVRVLNQKCNRNFRITYVYGPDVERDYHSPLYEDVLLPALQRINKGLPLDAINEAIYKLKNFESGSLLQKNMSFSALTQKSSPDLSPSPFVLTMIVLTSLRMSFSDLM